MKNDQNDIVGDLMYILHFVQTHCNFDRTTINLVIKIGAEFQYIKADEQGPVKHISICHPYTESSESHLY